VEVALLAGYLSTNAIHYMPESILFNNNIHFIKQINLCLPFRLKATKHNPNTIVEFSMVEDIS
jgi:hypothetical protein